MVVVQVEQFKRTHEEPRKDGPPPDHIRAMLVRYRDVLTKVLVKKLLPKSS